MRPVRNNIPSFKILSLCMNSILLVATFFSVKGYTSLYTELNAYIVQNSFTKDKLITAYTTIFKWGSLTMFFVVVLFLLGGGFIALILKNRSVFKYWLQNSRLIFLICAIAIGYVEYYLKQSESLKPLLFPVLPLAFIFVWLIRKLKVTPSVGTEITGIKIRLQRFTK